MASSIKNVKYDPCKQPYEFACDVQPHDLFTPPYDDIVTKEIESSAFYKSCSKFHDNTLSQKIEIIKESTFYKDQMTIIDNIKTHLDIDTGIGKLMSYGVKSPLDMSVLLTDEKQLKNGNSITPVNSELFISGMFYNDGIKLFDAIEIDNALTFSEGPLTLIVSNDHLELFNFSSLNVDKIRVDLRYLVYFKFKKLSFTIKEWKNYLEISVIYYVIKHFRLTNYYNSDICINHYKQLFPIHICNSIRNTLSNSVLPIKIMINDLILLYMEWLRNNPFQIEDALIHQAFESFRTLTVYINRCWISEHRNYISFLESSFLNHTDYVKDISAIYRDRQFLLYRNEEMNTYSKDYTTLMLNHNALYDSGLNILVIPPGVLNLPVSNMRMDHCTHQTFLGSLIGHELFHLIYYRIKDSQSKKWLALKAMMTRKYGSTSLDENMADLFGTSIIYNKFRNGTNEDKQCFFLSYTRQWCENTENSIHSNSRTRVEIAFEFLREEYATTFQCRLK